jgi:4-carboxymuconolactone decarboxylase
LVKYENLILVSEGQGRSGEEDAVRIPPLQADQWDDSVLAALRMIPEERRNPTDAGNALATFVNHPDLTRAYLTFSFYLLMRSTLSPRLRELAVLRVAHRSECAYEWDEHVVIGQQAGLSEDDIVALQHGDAADEFDRTVLRAVDELIDANRVSDATWAALGQVLDKRQLMDFVFTVGGYHMLAMALNTFGVEPAGIDSTGNKSTEEK